MVLLLVNSKLHYYGSISQNPKRCILSFLDSRHQSEGLCKIGTVCPSIHPFICADVFLEKDLYFSKFWHGVTNSYEVVCDRARCFEKKCLPQKWAKNMDFWVYWKILVLVFPAFSLQWKLILFAIFLHKSHIWGKSGF